MERFVNFFEYFFPPSYNYYPRIKAFKRRTDLVAHQAVHSDAELNCSNLSAGHISDETSANLDPATSLQSCTVSSPSSTPLLPKSGTVWPIDPQNHLQATARHKWYLNHLCNRFSLYIFPTGLRVVAQEIWRRSLDKFDKIWFVLFPKHFEKNCCRFPLYFDGPFAFVTCGCHRCDVQPRKYCNVNSGELSNNF